MSIVIAARPIAAFRLDGFEHNQSAIFVATKYGHRKLERHQRLGQSAPYDRPEWKAFFSPLPWGCVGTADLLSDHTLSGREGSEHAFARILDLLVS